MMPEQDFKIRGDTPRVIRSAALLDYETAYFIPGNQFEDGRSRLVIGAVPSPGVQEDIIRALDEADRLRRIDEAVVKLRDFIATDVEVRGQGPVSPDALLMMRPCEGCGLIQLMRSTHAE